MMNDNEKEVIDVKPIEEKEEPKEAPKASAQASSEPEEIQTYRQEIVECKKQRKVMVTWGIILTVVAFAAVMTFAFLLAFEIAKHATEEGEPVALVGIALGYCAAEIVSALLFNGGLVLIVLGSIVNSIKIKKRENRIRAYKKGQ